MTSGAGDDESGTDNLVLFQLGSLILLSGVSAGIGYAIGQGSYFVVFVGLVAWVGAVIAVLALSGSR